MLQGEGDGLYAWDIVYSKQEDTNNKRERAAILQVGKRWDVGSSGEISRGKKMKKHSQYKNFQENSIGFSNLQLTSNSESLVCMDAKLPL